MDLKDMTLPIHKCEFKPIRAEDVPQITVPEMTEAEIQELIRRSKLLHRLWGGPKEKTDGRIKVTQ